MQLEFSAFIVIAEPSPILQKTATSKYAADLELCMGGEHITLLQNATSLMKAGIFK